MNRYPLPRSDRLSPLLSNPNLVGEDPAAIVRIASIFACSSWLLLYRILLNRGFTLRQKGLSSDTIASLTIGISSTVWTLAVLRNVLTSHQSAPEDVSMTYHMELLIILAGLAQAPLLAQTLFGFWIISWLDGWWAEVMLTRPFFWSLVHLRSPFDWKSGLTRPFYLTFVICCSISVGIPGLASIVAGNPLNGILSLSGLFIFLLNGTTNNPYGEAVHRYADDRLRIALPTTHHEGTTYILPSRYRGIDATWTPKIHNEHLYADDEILVLFQNMHSGRWMLSEPLERLRKTLAAYHKRVILSTQQLELLAEWIYGEKDTKERVHRKIACDRAPGTHLIGRDLMFVLCHAEYLVFMGQARLPAATRNKLGTLRLMSRSGAGRSSEGEIHTIGFRSGLQGYEEAVRHVYTILDAEIDPSALSFKRTEPPIYSTALSKVPSTIVEYVEDLWNLSCQHTESTFSTLYFFTTVWFTEIGNRNGFHTFPLRCHTRDGDLVAQQITWRQIWYSGMIAQLAMASPILFIFFVLGCL